MKLKATPLLDPDASSSFVVDDLQPRQFVDWLDRHKVLFFQRSDDSEDDGESDPLTVEDFGQFVVDLQLQDYPYIGGAAPRTTVPVRAAPGRDVVFTANERCVVALCFLLFMPNGCDQSLSL